MTKNDFIDYLNSTNHISGDSTGSLAEKQVKSEYFEKVNIERALAETIYQSVVQKKHEVFILTGHAGDGKTSILAQVLRKLGKLNTEQGLSEEKEDSDFYYVKDMSEISSNHQVETLQNILEAPKNEKTSLLISNTGPLLKSMVSLLKTVAEQKGTPLSSDELQEIRNSLLQQLDKNENTSISLGVYQFSLINIARLDNVNFSSAILKKFLQEELWEPCSSCEKQNSCPMYANYTLLTKKINQVSYFVENFYRYLFECDKRMTIRQMLGQISFALTGNLTCEQIHEKTFVNGKFHYNFANLFFGYVGTKENPEFRQIKGIDQIRKLDIDGLSLKEDYAIFVEKSPLYFSKEVNQLLNPLLQRRRRHYQAMEPDPETIAQRNKEEREERKAVRRFFLLYQSHESSKEQDHFSNQIYGPQFSSYRDLTAQPQAPSQLKQLSKLIFEALYMRNTGFMYGSGGDSYQNPPLPLTLRRDKNSFQSVMLVLGEIEKRHLEVKQIPLPQVFEDTEGRQQLVLQVKEKIFPLTYPLVSYFSRLNLGDISCDNNPSLTHGIAALDALLMEQYAFEQDGENGEIVLFYRTTKGQEKRHFYFENGMLTLD